MEGHITFLATIDAAPTPFRLSVYGRGTVTGEIWSVENDRQIEEEDDIPVHRRLTNKTLARELPQLQRIHFESEVEKDSKLEARSYNQT